MGGTLQAHKIQGCAIWSENKQDIDFAAFHEVQNPAPDHGVVPSNMCEAFQDEPARHKDIHGNAR